MIDYDRWKEIFSVLKSNKLRTFLTAFGVFWGIFMLMIMLGAGKGLRNGATAGFGDFATNSVFIWPEQTSMAYKGFPRGRYFTFDLDDKVLLEQKIPEIEIIAPRINVQSWLGGSNDVTRGLESGPFIIYGDYPEMNLIDPMEITQGRFINFLDIEEKRKVAIIGKKVYESLFKKGEEPIDDYIRIQGVYFKVVGVFKSKHSGGWADFQNQVVFLPYTTMIQVYNYGNIVGWFSMTSKPNVPASVVEEKALNILAKRHNVHPDDKAAFGHENVEVQFQKMQGLFFGIDMLVWIVGIGTLLAGVIGVTNIMLIVIKERTREIGIQRAIGARPMTIIRQIITESVFLTTISGYVGLVMGIGLIEGINFILANSTSENNAIVNPEVNLQTALWALLILITSGVLAGIIPARRAISIKPIEALRYE